MLVVLLVVPAAYGLALATRLSGAIGRTPITALSPHGGGPFNVLVIGSDSREGLTDEDLLEIGTNAVDGERTDSIFILSVSGSRAAILAFPRDLWVSRCDGSNGRINAALVIGGADCLIDTVEQTSGIPVHGYMAVSFGGFRDIVDSVGGVDICVEKPLNDPFANVNLEAGCQVLDGTQALGYVRTRKLDNDFERIRRQQQFLGALAGKLAVPATVLNPSRAFEVTGAVGAALTADDGLGLTDLLRIANGARGLASGASVTATVPGTGARIGGAAVLEIDQAAAEPLFASFRDGSVFAQATAGLSPADVQVRVLNGAGVGGLAGSTRDALTGLGYDVVGIGDADGTPTTQIQYAPDQLEAAEMLARNLPVAVQLVESGTDAVLVLVLGQDLASGL